MGKARTSSIGRAALVAAMVAASVGLVRPARADALTAEEQSRLDAGSTVVRQRTYAIEGGRYIGGVTYTVIDNTMAEVGALLDDVSSYRRVLPRTKTARLVGHDGGDRLVELVSGNAVVEARYTIRVRRRGNELRFWLDPDRPHGIDDAWGFFRTEPFVGPSGEPKVLLTYGVLVDVGGGMVAGLFEERIRAALLSVPDLVRRQVAEVRRP